MKSSTVWFGLLAKSACNGLSQYYEKSESLLNSAKHDAASRIGQEVKQMAKDLGLTDDEEYAEWSVKMQDHETTYDMLFTNFFRFSFIVLAYAVLEDHLHRLCLALYDAKRLTESPPVHPRRNIIKKYRSYIDKAASSVDPGLWERIEDLQSIRNCITHSSGNVSRSRQQSDLLRIAQSNVGIHISSVSHDDDMTPLYLQHNMIMIEPEYCKSLVHDIQTLLEAICKATYLPTTITFEGSHIIFS